LVEQLTLNQRVLGSSPRGGTDLRRQGIADLPKTYHEPWPIGWGSVLFLAQPKANQFPIKNRWRAFEVAEVRKREFKLDVFKWLKKESAEDADVGTA
jgi:hypothetical protein